MDDINHGGISLSNLLFKTGISISVPISDRIEEIALDERVLG